MALVPGPGCPGLSSLRRSEGAASDVPLDSCPVDDSGPRGHVDLVVAFVSPPVYALTKVQWL